MDAKTIFRRLMVDLWPMNQADYIRSHCLILALLTIKPLDLTTNLEWWVEKLTSCCYEEPISQILTVGNFTGQKIWSLKQMRWGVAVVEKKIITGCTVWTHLDPSVQSIACPLCPWLQLILQVFVVKVCSCKDVFCPFSWLPLEQRGIYSHPQSLSLPDHTPLPHLHLCGCILGW